MPETILVIAAHPDDEVLGCGGTIKSLVDRGKTVHVGFLSDGVSSRDMTDTSKSKIELEARRYAARKAADILGVEDISFGDFPDNRMDGVELLAIVKNVERLIDKYKPYTIFTHHSGDLNIDHRCTHNAVVTACRPQINNSVKTLLFFEVASSTEWQVQGAASCFEPNWYQDISHTIESKILALQAYDMELRQWPHPRSRQGVEYLSRWRGCIVGKDAAEAFMLGRNIQ